VPLEEGLSESVAKIFPQRTKAVCIDQEEYYSIHSQRNALPQKLFFVPSTSQTGLNRFGNNQLKKFDIRHHSS
jgi:hypothetical protein